MIKFKNSNLKQFLGEGISGRKVFNPWVIREKKKELIEILNKWQPCTPFAQLIHLLYTINVTPLYNNTHFIHIPLTILYNGLVQVSYIDNTNVLYID